MIDASLVHVRAGDPLDELLEILLDQGGVIIEGVLDGESVESIRGELQPFVDDADPDMDHLNDGVQAFYAGTRNVTGMASKSPTFVDEVLLDPTLLAIADEVLGPICSDISLNVGHLLVRDPGAPQQFLHRDDAVWAHLASLLSSLDPQPQLSVSSVTALGDFTADAGATRVVPGSHRWERDRQPERNEVAVAEMPAGSSVVYLGSTIHAGGANVSNQPRVGFHMSYVVGWLRTEENNVLATPPAVARALPRRAQELVGYGYHDAINVGGGYIGHLDLKNPVDMLRAGQLGAKH